MIKNRKRFSLFLVLLLILTFSGSIFEADAAALGKKKKGYSSKKKGQVVSTAVKAKSSAKAASKKTSSVSLSASTVIDDTAAGRKIAAPVKKSKSKKKAKKVSKIESVSEETLSTKVVIGDDEKASGKKPLTLAATAETSYVEEYPLAKTEKKQAKKQSAAPATKASNDGFFSKYFGNAESRLKWFPGLYLNVGANVLEDSNSGARKIWTKLGLIPRFSYEKFSFAYDLTFHFDENNALRKGDWDSFDDFVRKIYYIYYGSENSRFNARIEMLDDVTLGSGAIFRNYCGSLRYPLLDKKVGGVFSWNSGYDDTAKFFVDDIASPAIYGVSAEITPHDKLSVGAQLISDNKVNTGWKNENVSVGSVHLGIPLISNSGTKFKIYEEIGSINNFGSGMHTGLITEVQDLTFKNEFRVFGSNYIPNYFDTLYEMERHYKGRALIRLADNGERYSGWFNEVKAKISDSYTLRLSYEKDYAPYLVPHLSLGVDYTGTEYKKLKLSFNYDRKNLYYSGVKNNGSIYGIKARYDISESSSLTYEMRHILNLAGREADSVNIETQLKF